LKIAGRVAFFTIFSAYQPPSPKLQHIRQFFFPLLAMPAFDSARADALESRPLRQCDTVRSATFASSI
jgi:hypothetical protein